MASRPTLSSNSAGVAVAQAAISSVANSPHAVNQIGAGTAATFYYYDDRGNQTLRDAPGTAGDRTIRYSADGRAHEIQMGNGQTTRFWYGPDGQRYKRQDGSTITLYIGGVEILIQGGVQTARRYAAGVALQTISNGTVQTTRYLFHDHLGSLVRIANANGSVAESLDYATFGARRDYSSPASPGAASNYTPRGFTGHEVVNGAQVTHMNGRIYDEQLARFLQPDPVVQAPTNGQSWNAYTYVFNNPLAYTDPTGQFGIMGGLALGWAMHNYVHKGMIRSGMRAIGPEATGLAVGVGCSFAGPWGILCAAGGSYDAARAFGASSKEARQAAVAGAFTAAVSYGLNVKYGGQVTAGRVAISALAGGIASEIQGGKFGNGFVSAGLTTAVMPQVGFIQNDFGRTVVGAIIGGTISEATGGKFANGAISGAIQGAMSKRPAPQGKAFGQYKFSGGDGTEGAPDDLKALIANPETRQAALRKMASNDFPFMDPESIFYEHKIGYYKGDMVDALTAPDGTVTFYMTTFSNTYEVAYSIMVHEYDHVLRYRFNLANDSDGGVEDEMHAYRRQLTSDRFDNLPTGYQKELQLRYNDALRKHIYNTTGQCKSLETCQ